MKVLIVYGRLYASCLVRAAQGLSKNPWTVLLPMALLAAFSLLARMLASLGFIGGLLMMLVAVAAGSAYLYFVGEIVGRSTVRLSEFQLAVRAYFWSLMNLGFVLWIAELVLGLLLGGNPNRSVLMSLFWLACWILLNPAPEIIYQVGTYGGLATVQRSVAFLQESWIEWVLPMVVIGLAYWFGWRRFAGLLVLGGVGSILSGVLLGALFHYVMLFRGFLFQELNGSTHRQRMFKYRNAGNTRCGPAASRPAKLFLSPTDNHIAPPVREPQG
jgi:hypothetical protein